MFGKWKKLASSDVPRSRRCERSAWTMLRRGERRMNASMMARLLIRCGLWKLFPRMSSNCAKGGHDALEERLRTRHGLSRRQHADHRFETRICGFHIHGFAVLLRHGTDAFAGGFLATEIESFVARGHDGKRAPRPR